MTVPVPTRSRGHNNFRPRKTAMLLAQRIVTEISDRKLAAGDPLPPEHEMLAEYEVARGTLREALRFLEIQGVIRIKTGPRGGPIVSSPSSRHLASVFAMHMQLSHTSFRSVLEAREVLEPAMASRAAERISPEDLETLRQSTVRMAEQIEDVDAFLAENERFHSLIARGAGNELFSLVIGSLNWICDATPLGVEYPRISREKVLQDHVEMYEAIAARDAALAGERMARHIGDFAGYLRHRYPEVVDAELRWDQVDA
jgi:GntR family transcriptional regulator, transcriptional repressor for pyruvate dehydrogenase complex